MLRGLALLVCALACLTACGSSATTRKAAPPARQCPKAVKALARLQADIAQMRAASRIPVRDRLQGGPAMNAATDRFLHDVAVAPIPNLKRNRLIDHAMGTLSGSCEQCFQALEAARPVIGIRFGEKGC